MNTLDFNTLKPLSPHQLGLVESKANSGDNLSWHYLGLHYLAPSTRNIAKAIECFNTAAMGGVTTSYTILADLYCESDLVTHNIDLAVNYYNQACALGDIDAIRALAILHYRRFLKTGANIELSLSTELAEKAKNLGYEDIYNYIFSIMKSTT